MPPRGAPSAAAKPPLQQHHVGSPRSPRVGNKLPVAAAPPTKYPPTPLPEPRDPTTREELELVRLWQDITHGSGGFEMARVTLASAPSYFFPEELLRTARTGGSKRATAAKKDVSFDRKLRSLEAIEDDQKEDQDESDGEGRNLGEQSDDLDDDDYTNNYFDDGEEYGGGGGGGFDDGDDEPSFY